MTLLKRGVTGVSFLTLFVALVLTRDLIMQLRQERDSARQVLQRVSSRRQSVGSRVTADWTQLGMDQHVASGDPIALLLIPSDACLVCLVELDRWKSLANGAPSLGIAVILVGGRSAVAERIVREEGLPFHIIADSDRAIARRLGMDGVGVTRLLVLDNQIHLVADGPDPGPVGFPEALGRLVGYTRRTGRLGQ